MVESIFLLLFVAGWSVGVEEGAGVISEVLLGVASADGLFVSEDFSSLLAVSLLLGAVVVVLPPEALGFEPRNK